MRQPVETTTRDWVRGHEGAMRRAAAEAIAASNRWRQRNAELMEKYRADGREDYAATRDKAGDLELTDAYGTYSFFAGKAQMHASVLQGAAAARALLGPEQVAPEPSAPAWPAAADRTVPSAGRRPRPYSVVDDAGVYLGGLVEPGPLTDPALRDTNSPTGPASGTRREAHSALGPVGGKQGEASLRGLASPTLRVGVA